MIFAIVLFVVAVAWRVISGVPHTNDYGWLHNFAPLSAIALCGATFLPRRAALIMPLAALLVSDVILNKAYGFPLVTFEMAARYVALAAIVWVGLGLRQAPRMHVMVGSSIGCSALFYFISNSASWWTEPGYAKTFNGWFQALTVGLPGYPPTLSFYRNTLLSDVLFTVVFVLCMKVANSRQSSSTPMLAEVRS